MEWERDRAGGYIGWLLSEPGVVGAASRSPSCAGTSSPPGAGIMARSSNRPADRRRWLRIDDRGVGEV